MEEYKVKQIWPAHADHISGYRDKYLDEMFKNEEVIAQRKYDGERMLIHFNGNETYCTSRRHSKKTDRFMENQDKILDLPTNVCLGYTVIDCECYSNSWSDIVGILHSLPERAHELQKTVPVKFAVFDCIWYCGTYVGDRQYKDRLIMAIDIIDRINRQRLDDRFHFTRLYSCESREHAKQLMEEAINEGFEGIVVKSLDRRYYDKGAMLKCKKFETVDVVVYDFQKGRGKYAGTIGALKVGYYDNGKIVHVSQVNCSTDEERNYWRDNWFMLQYSVIEVKCQEITEKSLRHPVYVRRRPDKSAMMCTKETIFKEA